MTARYLGTTDDVTTCDCCGRTGLKNTVVIEMHDDAEPLYYGVTCAAHALKTTAKEVRYEAKRADTIKREKKAAERQEEHNKAMAPWYAWLNSQVPSLVGQTFLQIERLGGYCIAHKSYEAQLKGSTT